MRTNLYSRKNKWNSIISLHKAVKLGTVQELELHHVYLVLLDKRLMQEKVHLVHLVVQGFKNQQRGRVLVCLVK